MAKAGKTNSGTQKPTCAGCTMSKTACVRNGTNGAATSALPFSHRTPAQLHASVYARGQGR